MSDHARFRLHAWYDGELPHGETAGVEMHLSGCTECRSTAATVRALDAALAEPAATLPAGFVAATHRRALARRLPEAPLWWLAVPVSWRTGLAALLLLAALAGVGLGGSLASGHSGADELAAALDTPATDVMTATIAEEGR